MADPKSTKYIDARRKGAEVRNSGITPEQRFWLKVQKSDGCWEWQGQRNHKGYGEISVNRRWLKAHRYSWELANGPILKGHQVCHTCDNPACVRPDHLFAGTNSDNQRDAVKKGRASTATLSPSEVRAVRGLFGQGLTARQIGARFGVSIFVIQRIKDRKAYAYVE